MEKAKQADANILKEQTPLQPELPSGPVIARPCEYRGVRDPEVKPAEALKKNYNKWKKMDTDAMELDLDNEDTTTEGKAMRMSAAQGSAMVSCEGYTKDREEYDLDRDIEKEVGDLKKVLAQRLKDAANLKLEGNKYMGTGDVKKAKVSYQKGLTAMELCKQSSVLMSESMASKNSRLIGDLLRNLAATQMQLGEYAVARDTCDLALQEVEARSAATGRKEEDDKARYRKALANLHLGCKDAASEDIERLAQTLGENDANVKRLRAELQASTAVKGS